MGWEIILLAVAFILLAVAIALFWFWRRHYGAVRITKTISSEGSKVVVEAHRDIQELVLEDVAEKEKLRFVRSAIRGGSRLEFIYPASHSKARLQLSYDGREQVIEVEPV